MAILAPSGTTRDREFGARTGRGDPLGRALGPGGRRRAHRPDRGRQPAAQRDRGHALRRGPRRGRRGRRARRRRRPGEELPPLLGVPCTIKESFARRRDAAHAPARSPAATSSPSVGDRRRSGWSTPARSRSGSPTPPSSRSGSSPRTRSGGGPTTPTTRRRTAGGSSGGEGAAIGSGFAPFGLGTDIGGSIRLPAFFNGVFGHKPTGALVPHTGHYPFPNERGAALLGCGPLARRAEDLMPVLRVDRRARRDRPRPSARSSSATRPRSRSRACGW